MKSSTRDEENLRFNNIKETGNEDDLRHLREIRIWKRLQ